MRFQKTPIAFSQREKAGRQVRLFLRALRGCHSALIRLRKSRAAPFSALALPYKSPGNPDGASLGFHAVP
jgi:hypothetical protein